MNHDQPLLLDTGFDFPFRGAGHRRTAIGAMAEQIVCGFLGLVPEPKGKSDRVCPDARGLTGLPYEIKSVHCAKGIGGKTVLYKWRLEKECEVMPDTMYAFLCHHSRNGGKARTAAIWLDRLAADGCDLLVVPSAYVRAEAWKCKLCKPRLPRKHSHRRAGYHRPGYADGYYGLPLARFACYLSETSYASTELHGRRIRANVTTIY